jgi:hypothetical protein
MSDRSGENHGTQSVVTGPDLPPKIDDTSLKGLRAATTILENLRIIGNGLRGISMVDDLRDEGLLGPDEDFEEIRLLALQSVSERAALEESVIARGDPTPEETEALVRSDILHGF